MQLVVTVREIERQELGPERHWKQGRGVGFHGDMAASEVGQHAVHRRRARCPNIQADEKDPRPSVETCREVQSALAWTTENAAANSVRVAEAIRSNAGREAVVIGTPPSWSAMVAGSA